MKSNNDKANYFLLKRQSGREIIVFALIFLIHFPTVSRCQSSHSDTTWSPLIQISFDSVLATSPQIATNGDTIHIIWFGIDTLGTASHDGIQYTHSYDGGQTFIPQETVVSPDGAYGPGCLTCSGSFVYVVFTGVIDGSFGMIIRRSNDAGTSWEAPRILLTTVLPRLIASYGSTVCIYFISPASGTNGMLRSDDYGDTWRTINSNMPQLNDLYFTTNQLHGIGTVISGTHSEVGYWYSDNYGINWIGPEIISHEDAVPSLYPKLSVNQAGTIFAVWNDSGNIIIRRDDGYDEEGNLQWRPQITIDTGANAIFSDITTSENIVSIVWDVHKNNFTTVQDRHSTDNGLTFSSIDSPQTEGQAGEPVAELVRNRLHMVWAGEINSNSEIIYRQHYFEVSHLPTTFTLMQNYPNPVNGLTHIEYDVPTAEHVTVKMFNILGQMVATLVDEVQEGRQHIRLDANRFSSGVYFYRLESRFFTQTKKMLILR